MRYIVGLIVIVALILFGVLIFDGGDSPKTPGEIPTTLPEYASTDAYVSWTVKGAVNATEEHREIRITVSRNGRNVEVIQGYEGNVIKANPLSNTEAAFSEFLHSLERAGFRKVKNTSLTDDSGVCPTGQRFIYEVKNTDDEDLRLWAASCSGVGTFAGQVAIIENLFKKQIPDYNDFTRDVRLNN